MAHVLMCDECKTPILDSDKTAIRNGKLSRTFFTGTVGHNIEITYFTRDHYGESPSQTEPPPKVIPDLHLNCLLKCLQKVD